MAGVSTKAIKSRMKSMESTRQITKAMELVAASKLRGAQERALNNRTYFNTLFETMDMISKGGSEFPSPFMKSPEGGKALFIVIAGDRGMAGGYNNNVFKYTVSMLPENAVIFPLGKRAGEYFKRSRWECISEAVPVADMTVGSCYTVSRMLADQYREGRFSSISIVYTELVSLLTQTPRSKELLPVRFNDDRTVRKASFIYEGGDQAVFDSIVPEYMAGVLYCALKEGFASEQAARRTAMDAASKNADEMISKLTLHYNMARQAAITQEITEIVAGSEQ